MMISTVENSHEYFFPFLKDVYGTCETMLGCNHISRNVCEINDNDKCHDLHDCEIYLTAKQGTEVI